jgi:hypothetical protein
MKLLNITYVGTLSAPHPCQRAIFNVHIVNRFVNNFKLAFLAARAPDTWHLVAAGTQDPVRAHCAACFLSHLLALSATLQLEFFSGISKAALVYTRGAGEIPGESIVTDSRRQSDFESRSEKL